MGSDILAISQKLKTISKSRKININLLLEQIRDAVDANYVPIEVFSQNLPPLQAVVCYLKDFCGLKYSEIAERLNRDERTIWTTYQKSSENSEHGLDSFENQSGINIPLWILKSRRLSILETIAMFLHQDGMKLTEIAGLLCKNTSTIWTALNRARKKEVEM